MSSQEIEVDIKKLYKEFNSLGDWTKELRITDYPCLGGDNVSPSYVFQQVSKRYKPKISKDILDTLERMKELKCEDSTLINFLVWCDLESQDILSGTQYIRDTNWIASTSRNKEEFYLRAERLYSSNTARKQSLLAPYDSLKNIKPINVLDFSKA